MSAVGGAGVTGRDSSAGEAIAAGAETSAESADAATSVNPSPDPNPNPNPDPNPNLSPSPNLNPSPSPSPNPDPAATGAASSRVAATDALVVGADGLARPVWASRDPMLRDYYDTEWGMPVRDEQGLFERLSLEAFQAGLSWATILRKRDAFRAAFADFDPDVVAAFDDADVVRLLDDAAIVRNRLKIAATITNARATVALRTEGGLGEFVWSFRPSQTPRPRTMADVPSTSPESVALSKALKAKGFTFVGPTGMFALMEAIGMVDTHLMGSHRRGTSGVWPE